MHRGARRLPVVMYLALAGALAACVGQTTTLSGDPSGVAGASESALPTPGTSLTACEIVARNSIRQVLMAATGERVEVAEGVLDESPNVLSPGHATCSYAGEWGELEVDVTPDDGANLYAAALAAAGDAQVLEIGDGAFWSRGTERGFFRKGSVTVMLQFSGLAREVDVRQATVAVGRRAMNKL